jgi:flavin reductase (DIM6/NTAB) family NADH-FMN oxidoreductase RutF
MSIHPGEFRKALGLFPTGVAIISGRHRDGQLLGMTVSSFNSVSLDPPLVVFSVARSAASFLVWQEMPKYGISVLARGQDDLSTRFSRTQSDKWALVHPVFGQHDVPLIPGALVGFECERYAVHDGGDHAIFVAKVLSIHAASTPDAEPLVFFAGRYCGIRRTENPVSEVDGMLLHGW